MKEIQNKLQQQMEKTIEALKHEFSTIRAGRANAQMLDKIRVDYYGTPTPINQVGSISVPEPRTLMINPWDKSAMKDIETAIEVFSAVEPNIIIFHLEACENKEEVMKYITLIKEKGSRVGIAIKPETPIEQVYEYLPYIHTCLVMTVEPGKGGQTLITDMIAKISELKLYTERKNIDIDIEADGGINLKTATRVKRAGANVLVAGTAILMASDYKVIIDELKEEE